VPPSFVDCFAHLKGGPGDPTPDYEQFKPVIGSHCNGTNHQDIVDVERVVFLGDSVTTGTPPTVYLDYYRNLLAAQLVDRFGLVAPSDDWLHTDFAAGRAAVMESGDFASCSAWGAKADDMLGQLGECFGPAHADKRTLVVMTMGGNDLANLATGFAGGVSDAALWTQTESFMADIRSGVEWLKDPANVPGGTYVVFSNLYEFTDATGDVTSCPGAAAAGFDTPIIGTVVDEMVVWSMEQFMSIAVDTNTDMLFLLETFCGHGWASDDPAGRCYQGPKTERWFDVSCTHPNPRGHEVLAFMFGTVVSE
jgi:lysophospholipase L1-like esterase